MARARGELRDGGAARIGATGSLPELPIRHALALGAIQGPAELLPVSSSGHVVLMPALLGWPYTRLDPELRKAFEVALHLGTAAALVIELRREMTMAVRELDGRRLFGAALELAPAGVAGLTFERRIEEQLSEPRTVAWAQLGAGLVLLAADRRPSRRRYVAAKPIDRLLLGIAQSAALVPGISRNGATMTAARLRGFERSAAWRLSREAALPVILGAGGLKVIRIGRAGRPANLSGPFAAGFGVAFLSTLASQRLLRWAQLTCSVAPVAAYRITLGSLGLMCFFNGCRPRTIPPFGSLR